MVNRHHFILFLSFIHSLLHAQAQLAVMDGQSAALDLMESFGFEGGVEPTSPTDPGISFFPTDVSYPTASHSEPTLLDLSLPNSPSEDLKER